MSIIIMPDGRTSILARRADADSVHLHFTCPDGEPPITFCLPIEITRQLAAALNKEASDG